VNVPSLGKEAWVVQSSGDDGRGVVDKFGTFDLYTGLRLGLVVVSDPEVNLGLLVDTVDNSRVVLALVLGLDVVSFISTRTDHFRLKWSQDEQEVYFTRLGLHMTQVEKFLPHLHVVYAQWTTVWSLNYLCGYWSVVYLLNCCVVIELTKRKSVDNFHVVLALVLFIFFCILTKKRQDGRKWRQG